MRGCLLCIIPSIAAAAPVPGPVEPADRSQAVLLSPLPAAAAMTQSQITTLEGSAEPPAAPDSDPALPGDPPGGAAPQPGPPADALLPNADGLIDLCNLEEGAEDGDLPNPFRLRYEPPGVPREVRVEIESVLLGKADGDASAVINGRLYSRGDALEGLPIAAISAQGVELRRGDALLRLPLQDKPLVLRLPR